jgi:hypothetical protein
LPLPESMVETGPIPFEVMKPELDPIYACENIILVPTWADGLDDFVYCCALCVEAEVKFYC